MSDTLIDNEYYRTLFANIQKLRCCIGSKVSALYDSMNCGVVTNADWLEMQTNLLRLSLFERYIDGDTFTYQENNCITFNEWKSIYDSLMGMCCNETTNTVSDSCKFGGSLHLTGSITTAEYKGAKINYSPKIPSNITATSPVRMGISFWYRHNDFIARSFTPPNNFGFVWGVEDETEPLYQYFNFGVYSNAGQNCFSISFSNGTSISNNEYRGLFTDYIIPQAAWQHVALNINKDKYSLYINGEFVQTIQATELGGINIGTTTFSVKEMASYQYFGLSPKRTENDQYLGFNWDYNFNIDEFAMFTRLMGNNEIFEQYDICQYEVDSRIMFVPFNDNLASMLVQEANSLVNGFTLIHQCTGNEFESEGIGTSRRQKNLYVPITGHGCDCGCCG